MTREFGNWNWQHYKPILAEKKKKSLAKNFSSEIK